MPADEPLHIYETLRYLCLVNPLQAKQDFMALLDGDKVVLESVLKQAASDPGGARVRSMIARSIPGHRAFPDLVSILELWQQSETDEFARMAIADALAKPERKKASHSKLTSDLPDLSKTYEFLSQRLRHRILNVLPRAGLSVDQLRDALIEGKDLDTILALVNDLKSTLRHLERNIDQITEEVDFEPMNIRLIDWLQAFAARFRSGRSDVEIMIVGDATATVNANRYLLDTIFRNLWVNSAQAVIGKCQITTRVSVERTQIVVAIVDNGPGFTAVDAESAFRLQYSSSRDPERGRGHMEVADAMRRLAGNAAVELVPNNGFRAVLRLPRR